MSGQQDVPVPWVRPHNGAVFLALTGLLMASTSTRAGCGYPDPFEHAQRVPSAVHTYISIVEGAKTLKQLLETPVGPGIEAFYEASPTHRAWTRLADSLKIDSNALLDELLTGRVTLVSDAPRRSHDENMADPAADARRADADQPPLDQIDRDRSAWPFQKWVIMGECSEDVPRQLIRTLNARIREFIDGTPLYLADDASIFFAHREGRLYLATTQSENLLRIMIAKSVGPTLADDPDFRAARKVGPGQIAFFRRGEAPDMWSAGSARIHSSGMRLRFLNSTPRQPLSEQEESVNIDLLDILAQDALYVSIEHTPLPEVVRRAHSSPSAGLGLWPFAPLATARPDMLRSLGPTMFTVVAPGNGHQPDEANQQQHEHPAGYPAVAIGVELSRSMTVITELDEFMSTAASRLFERAAPDQPPSSPIINSMWDEPGKPREVDLHDRGVPLRAIGIPDQVWPDHLIWSTSFSEDRAWWIASTDKTLHDRLHESLSALPSDAPRGSSCNLARGAAYGSQISDFLMRWPAVNEDVIADPKIAQVRGWAELLKSISVVRWRTVRIDDHKAMTYAYIAWPGKEHVDE